MGAAQKPTLKSITQIVRFRQSNVKAGAQSLADVLPEWFAAQVLKPARTMDFIEPLWRNLPPLLRRTCVLHGIHRSTLTIHCDQATARAELERLLRNGLLAQIQAASHGRVKKVKTMVKSSG
jgi:hypothetical protein